MIAIYANTIWLVSYMHIIITVKIVDLQTLCL